MSASYGAGGYCEGGYGVGGFGTGGGTGFTYVNLVPSDDVDQIYNRFTGTADGLDPQTWEDLDSQEDYFIRDAQVQSLVVSEAELLNQVQWKTGQFSQPLNRVESIDVMPLVDLEDVGQIDAGLGRELGDRIVIRETPPGFDEAEEDDYVIQQLTGQIGPRAFGSCRLSFMLWPAAITSFWILGDAQQSLAGVSTRPSY